jgi:hypothetical protein
MKLKYIDDIGMVSSVACAIHCLLLPFLITILPYFGLVFLVDETFEIIMLILSMIMALFSLCFGYKIHKNKVIFFLFSLGIVMLLLGNFAHENNWGLSSLLILFLGGTTIAFSHFFNKKLCKSCQKCSLDN